MYQREMTSARSRAQNGKLPWRKVYTRDWRADTCQMSFELRGFYNECLNAMWEAQGALPTDDKKLAMLLGGNPRTIRKLIPQLIEARLLIKTGGGYCSPAAVEDDAEPDIETGSSQRIESDLEANSSAIRHEFTSKVPKSPMNSTRDLETRFQRLETRGQRLVYQGKVLGKGVEEDTARAAAWTPPPGMTAADFAEIPS
ncbi:hypothetical protein W911_14670 [Hyphomicrobium nitrativorans NL23]|uniref:Uncharacterized protein n=1 Tax=Hyphomicrobium nitrativorans NL23 TaxID=1029756 RepID=V5SHM6_9HYPH|nr:DUF1376 domain-containing protein [Hyphomicrobium nitrativorans]AHB50356.1 hypothetical protein W911_14670 [Hyphomicrobium nitrativorans NL23]